MVRRYYLYSSAAWVPLSGRNHGLGTAIAPKTRLSNLFRFSEPPLLSGIDGIAVSGLLCELDAIIRQDGVDFVGHNFQNILQKFPSSASIRRFGELGDGELAGAVNGNEQI